MRRFPAGANDARFLTFIDNAGNPPCTPPDDCDVCRLFTQQRPNETRGDWVRRAIFPPYRRTS